MKFIKGEVVYCIFHNDRNDYGVYRVGIDETDEPSFDFDKTATITGFFHNLEIGAVYEFKGNMVFTDKYGYSFVVDHYERVLPTSKTGIVEYLSGESFPKIGKKTAETIVDGLGLDAISLILNNPKVLNQFPTLSDSKKETIVKGLINNRDLESTLVTLYSYGITPMLAMRIYNKLGSSTLDIIKTDPYSLIDMIEGIAFIKADQIALKTGVNPKSENRIQACISYTLLNNANETGNTYIEKDEAIQKVKSFLSFNDDEIELINKAISTLIFRNKIIEKNNTIQDIRLYNAENYIAKKLLLMRKNNHESIFPEEVKRVVSSLEKQLNIVYEDEQETAILCALNNNISIITGGPGTGKTTIERGILYAYNQLVSSDASLVKLCAPTGKAAKRIEESTNYEAKTIHKLLGYDAMGCFTYNKFNQLDANLVIVDEASMIDVFLFKSLLEALPNDAKLVIVGDSDQLPSIGPGEVLLNLIDSGLFTTTRLHKIHRQKENSKIISLAYNVLDGEITTELDESHDELAFIPCRREDLLPILKNTINHFINLGYSLFQDIQILIPIYKTMVGIDVVNKFVQMNFNVCYDSKGEIGENTFFIDDKVIQLINQYEDGIMNGDMGIITDMLSQDEVVVNFQGKEVRYKGANISNFKLAYSISIHKAQGSEFPVVILPFFRDYRLLLNKKLVYTAITRAKEHLVIIGDGRCLNDTIKINSLNRKTYLKDFLFSIE